MLEDSQININFLRVPGDLRGEHKNKGAEYA